MKIKIGKREFELTDPIKLERARKALPATHTDQDLLIEYDKMAGRILENGKILEPHQLWNPDHDRYQAKFNELLKEKNESLDRMGSALNKNVEHLRQFTSTLLTIDIALIGAVFALYSSNNVDLIKHPVLLGIGIFVFFIDAILVVFITDQVLIGENNKVSKIIDFLQRSYDEMVRTLNEYLSTGTSFSSFNDKEFSKIREFAEEEKALNMNPHFVSTNYLRITNWLFIAGLVFTFISLVDTSHMFSVIFNIFKK